MPAITTAAIALAGLGVSAYGTIKQMDAAKSQQEAQRQATAAEQKQESIRQQAMELEAGRRQREILRQQQRTRAMSLATATAQGAQGGSGLQGAYGQTQGQTGVNALGVSQNLDLGRQMFASNIDLSNARLGIATAQSNMATGQAFSSLGGSLITSASTLGNIFAPGGGSGGGYYGGSPSTNPNLVPYGSQTRSYMGPR